MFEIYSNSAKMALFYARNFCQEYRNEVITPEHLLLGILKENEDIFQEITSELKEIKKSIKNSLSKEKLNKPFVFEKENVILSESIKQILAFANHLAQTLNSEKVELEHLIFSILKSNTLASQLLKSYGISTFKIRKYIQNKEKEKNVKNLPIFLETYALNLNRWVQSGKCFPHIGRENEIERLISILGRYSKNNALLIGEAGVGKTALVEALTMKILQGETPPFLKNMQIYAIDLGQLISGTKYRGQFEERLKEILKEATENENIILFIDEIHTIIGAGSSEGSLDAANILKPPLSRGQLRCIGATTYKDFKKYIEKDKALMRRFQTIMLIPSTEEDTLNILKKVKNKIEEYHQVYFPEETLKAIVHYSNQYIQGRVFPDKAIDVLDEVAARVKIKSQLPTASEKMLIEELKEINEKIKENIEKKDFENAFNLKNEEIEIKEALKILKTRNPNTGQIVSVKDVEEVISIISGVPYSFFFHNNEELFNKLKNCLKKEVLYQNEAIDKILKTFKNSFFFQQRKEKPSPVLLFYGQTGTGKTFISNLIAKEVLPNPRVYYTLEMSEYSEKFMLSKLIGSPPGYVGYEEGGHLTEFIKRNPFSLILFENIDKANSEILRIIIKIIEKGYIEDSTGEIVNFKNTIIFFTITTKSNKKILGFEDKQKKKDQKEEIENLEEIKKLVPSELLDKIDQIVFFKPFTPSELKNILKNKLKIFLEDLHNKGFTVIIENEVFENLAKKIDKNKECNAFVVENIFKTELKNPLNYFISSLDAPCKILVFLYENNILFKKEDHYAPVV